MTAEKLRQRHQPRPRDSAELTTPATSRTVKFRTYSLERQSWFFSPELDLLHKLYLVGLGLFGVVRISQDVRDWYGWISLGFGLFLAAGVGYLWRRRHFERGTYLSLDSAGIEFRTRDMPEPAHIPLARLRRVRWSAGNLRIKTVDGEDHTILTSFLLYDALQELHAGLIDWGNEVGVDVLP